MTTPRKVLIVDDELRAAEVIQLRVESAGHEVVTATNGREALEKARADVPDLIISDVLMPEMDGYTLYKELKADSRTAAIPVLILTARAKMEETFKVVGVDDFIAKPFDGHNLLMKVEHLLQSSRKPREEAPAPDDNVPAPAPEAPVREGVRKVLFAGIDTEVLEAMQQQLKPYGLLWTARHRRMTRLSGPGTWFSSPRPDALMAGAEAGSRQSFEEHPCPQGYEDRPAKLFTIFRPWEARMPRRSPALLRRRAGSAWRKAPMRTSDNTRKRPS